MWSEETDKKVRDMMQQEPPYEEKGWEAMMPLLDKHLPQKKNRRRLLLLWLPILLIPGIIALLLTQKGGQKQTAATEQKASAAKTGNDNTKEFTPGNTSSPGVADPSIDNTDNQKGKASNTTIQSLPTTSVSASSSDDYKTISKVSNPLFPIDASTISNKPGNNRRNAQKPSAGADLFAISTTAPSTAGSTKSTVTSSEDISADTVTVSQQAVVNNETKENSPSPKQTSDTTVKEETPVTKDKTPVSKKDGGPKKKFAGNFAISLSAGPEYSSTSSFSNGQWKLQYGAGIQYSFSKHFTLRTGFYAGSKVYTAKPGDYHPPDYFWDYYPNLQKVDADCKVYEVPINLSYSFAAKNKHNYFVAAGVASVWMKKETYGYYYKDPAGQDQYRKRSISNENNHLFSTAQLSAGYQRQLNTRFSLAAEPYMKVPLSGIGYGKVKLKNGGVLFTILYKPFVKK